MYTDRYAQCLDNLCTTCKTFSKRNASIAIGFASDLDVVLEWQPEQLQCIIDQYLIDEPTYNEGDCIDSMESFARILSYFMINGLGAEIKIIDIDVYRYLQKNFSASYAVGGSSAQAGAALGAIGCPAILHLTDMSQPVCQFLDFPVLKTVTNNGLKTPMDAATTADPLTHFVWQYSKGQKFYIGKKEYEVPISSRLIMSYDNVHEFLPIQKEFTDFCEENAKSFSAYMLSGLNAMLNIEIVKKRTDWIYKHILALKKENPDCITFMDGGHFFIPEARDYIYDNLSPVIDILGINEDELVAYAERFGVKTDKDNIYSVVHSVQQLLVHYSARGIVLHTKDYSAYFGEPITGVNLEQGLTTGNLMAATRAILGKYGTLEECALPLSLPISPIGLKFREEIEKMDLNLKVTFVPSRYMEKPKFTIGLGDTFSAGFLSAFVK